LGPQWVFPNFPIQKQKVIKLECPLERSHERDELRMRESKQGIVLSFKLKLHLVKILFPNSSTVQIQNRHRAIID